MAFPSHPYEEILHISLTKIWIVKSTYFQEVWNFIIHENTLLEHNDIFSCCLSFTYMTTICVLKWGFHYIVMIKIYLYSQM